MKKNLFLILFFLPISAFSQIFGGGFLFGVCGGQVDGDETGGFDRAGLLSGVYVDANFSERSSLQIELYYIGKGSVLNEKYSDGTTIQIFKSNFRYVEIPFIFDFKLNDKFSLGFGPAFSYLISANIISYGYPVDTNSYLMNNYDFAPMVQTDFYLTDKLSINIKYSHSIFSIRTDDIWFNSNLSLFLKYKIK